MVTGGPEGNSIDPARGLTGRGRLTRTAIRRPPTAKPTPTGISHGLGRRRHGAGPRRADGPRRAAGRDRPPATSATPPRDPQPSLIDKPVDQSGHASGAEGDGEPRIDE